MEKTTQGNDEAAALPPAEASALIDLHIAEYEALMNRATYYIVIEASFGPIVLLWLTLMGQLWKSSQMLTFAQVLDFLHTPGEARAFFYGEVCSLCK